MLLLRSCAPRSLSLFHAIVSSSALAINAIYMNDLAWLKKTTQTICQTHRHKMHSFPMNEFILVLILGSSYKGSLYLEYRIVELIYLHSEWCWLYHQMFTSITYTLACFQAIAFYTLNEIVYHATCLYSLEIRKWKEWERERASERGDLKNVNVLEPYAYLALLVSSISFSDIIHIFQSQNHFSLLYCRHPPTSNSHFRISRNAFQLVIENK